VSRATRPLRRGCEGGAVLALQSQLRALVDAGLCVDGDFGRATDSAVRAYQRSCALLEDGIVGEITRSALIADCTLDDLRRLSRLIGLRGHAAVHALQASGLEGICITLEIAARTLPQIAADYWRAVVRVLPGVLDEGCPVGVHTALLSACYQLWVDDLYCLWIPAEKRDWAGLALMLASVPKYRQRRQREAALIA